MAWYYCNEDDRILSTEELRQEFDMFRSEGSYLDETFDEYLSGCMYQNNGSLIPLSDHLNHLRRELSRVRSYNNPDNDDWIETLTAQISECERYYKEV